MSEFDCPVKDCGRRACDPDKCKLYKKAKEQELLKTNKKLVNKIVELKQQKNTLEQYLRIEKEVSDETIKELEQQLSELKESQKQKRIIRLCERLDKAEQQNKQMLEALIMIYKTWHEDSILISSTKPIIESVTGKPIEEVMK